MWRQKGCHTNFQLSQIGSHRHVTNKAVNTQIWNIFWTENYYHKNMWLQKIILRARNIKYTEPIALLAKFWMDHSRKKFNFNRRSCSLQLETRVMYNIWLTHSWLPHARIAITISVFTKHQFLMVTLTLQSLHTQYHTPPPSCEDQLYAPLIWVIYNVIRHMDFNVCPKADQGQLRLIRDIFKLYRSFNRYSGNISIYIISITFSLTAVCWRWRLV